MIAKQISCNALQVIIWINCFWDHILGRHRPTYLAHSNSKQLCVVQNENRPSAAFVP